MYFSHPEFVVSGDEIYLHVFGMQMIIFFRETRIINCRKTHYKKQTAVRHCKTL